MIKPHIYSSIKRVQVFSKYAGFILFKFDYPKNFSFSVNSNVICTRRKIKSIGLFLAYDIVFLQLKRKNNYFIFLTN